MRLFLSALLLLFSTACGRPATAETPVLRPATPSRAARPIVIAHRGASGERPEHTAASYSRAIDAGADFIEPDLVLTKDGVLVARHENEISETTDVAEHPEFAARRTTKTIDGEAKTGWFTEDFTLEELKTLRAKERLALLRPANTAYTDERILTFAEILELVRRREAASGRRIGIYPETKHPAYFAAIGLPHDAPLLALLNRYGYRQASDPIFIQSFEVGNLERLHARTGVRLIQLIGDTGGPADRPGTTYAAMTTPAGLKAIARYATGIGPDKGLVLRWDGDGPHATGLVANAHAAGLEVHPYTLRAENYFLPSALREGINPRAHGRLADEIAVMLSAGIDGFFTDFPAIGVPARDRHVAQGKIGQ